MTPASWNPPEVEMFAGKTDKLNGLTYGSSEYEAQRKEMLGMALKHHYEHNRHHPEHFRYGVCGMTLIDLVEMFCDWLAATERHADGDIHKSIQHNTGRFKLDPQVVCVLQNTANLFVPAKEKGDGRAEATGGTGTAQSGHRLDG